MYHPKLQGVGALEQNFTLYNTYMNNMFFIEMYGLKPMYSKTYVDF